MILLLTPIEYPFLFTENFSAFFRFFVQSVCRLSDNFHVFHMFSASVRPVIRPHRRFFYCAFVTGKGVGNPLCAVCRCPRYAGNVRKAPRHTVRNSDNRGRSALYSVKSRASRFPKAVERADDLLSFSRHLFQPGGHFVYQPETGKKTCHQLPPPLFTGFIASSSSDAI